MPVILPEDLEDNWLSPINNDLDIKLIQELIQEYPEDKLDTYTVNRLRGKEYIGNVEEIPKNSNTRNLSSKKRYITTHNAYGGE